MESMAIQTELPGVSTRRSMILPSVFAFWLVGLLDKFTFGTILTDHRFLSDMGLTGHAAAIGALASVVVLTQALGNGIFGRAVDRFGPRRCAIVGIIGWVLSCALAALAQSLVVLVISRVLLGLAEGYTWPVGNALTVRWFPAERRGRARAMWLSAVCIGPGISGFVTAGLLGSLPWRGVFWFLGTLSLVVCLPLALLLVRDSASYAVDTERPARAGLLVWRTGRFWLATLAASGTSIAVWALATWLPSYLVTFRHTSLHTFQYYILVAYALGLVTMIGFSHVSDRLRYRTGWLAVAFFVAGLLLLIVGVVPAAPYLILIAGTTIIIYGVTTLIVQGFQDRMSHVADVGTENGLMNMISNIFAGVVPFAMGGLIDMDSGAYGYAFGFLFVLLAISAASAAGLRRLGY
jgi:MFS family permease